MIEAAFDFRLQPETAPPPAGDLWRVLPDQLTDKWNYQVRDTAPAPAVWRIGNSGNQYSRPYKMTEPVQVFCADLLAFACYGRRLSALNATERKDIVSAFNSVYWNHRAFTNNSGIKLRDDDPPRRNYITLDQDEMYKDADDPKFDAIRVCSWNGLGGLAGVVVGNELKVEYFRNVPTYYDVTILDDPRVFYATIIQRDGRLTNFPQLDGYQVPVPLMSQDDLYFPLKYLEKASLL